MTFHDKHSMLQMTISTGASVGFSLADIEAGLRILSLVAGITFSTVVFIRNIRKNRVNDERKKNT